MSRIPKLPMDVEVQIKSFIEEKFIQYDLKSAFPNPLLREDALDLLDRFCTVVYYPVYNDKNNGFHVSDLRLKDGSILHFVFINTAQTIEKQVFTAAHELGHIWNVDDEMLTVCELEDTPQIRELIINRFAATLLMPEMIFVESFSDELSKLVDSDAVISGYNLLKIVVILMNKFFVPMKSVVLRLYELGLLSESDTAFFLGESDVSEADIASVVNELLSEFGYVRFLNPVEKKWIEGFAEKLDIAESKNLLPQCKIDNIRKAFGFKAAQTIPTSIGKVIPINKLEGHDS